MTTTTTQSSKWFSIGLCVAILACLVIYQGMKMINDPLSWFGIDADKFSAGVYPAAPEMPPIVDENVDELIAKFEQLLQEEAAWILDDLQDGLTDKEIAALETKHAFELTPDMRALYRWRNGMKTEKRAPLFSYHEFIPLDEICTVRQMFAQDVETNSVSSVMIGHRVSWLGVIVDGAGDGYFFDPNRMQSEGSFFFCFAEDGDYRFYPAFRNFLAATLEGHAERVYLFNEEGCEVTDFGRANEIHAKCSSAATPSF